MGRHSVWLVAQTIFIVAASERSDSVWFPMWSRIELLPRSRRLLSLCGRIRACSDSAPGLDPVSHLSQCGLVGRTTRIVCYVNVAVTRLHSLPPYPSLSLYLPHPYLHLFFYLHPHSAISFSISRLPSHVGYSSHDILALYAKPLSVCKRRDSERRSWPI